MARLVLLSLVWLVLVAPVGAPLPDATANLNQHVAGHVSHDTLFVTVEARPALWRPDEGDSPPLTIQAFAEPGAAPSIPGPLIRVRTGMLLAVTVHNTFRDSVLVVHGLVSHPATADDTIQVAPGASREIRFRAGAPGTYVYWGTTSHAATLEDRAGPDTQLVGALVVDSAGARPVGDRIFVITGIDLDGDSTKPKPNYERFQVAINGRAWPHTERLAYSQGDSIHWRWVNASFEAHPMHLHGFYFRIDSRSGPLEDSAYAAADRRWVVTETIDPGTTMAMMWAPERAGNWLMHCHIFAHVEPDLAYPFPGDTLAHYPSPTGHPPMHMSGLILGVTIRPIGAAPGARSEPPIARREVRMVLRELPFLVDSSPGISIAFGTAPFTGRPEAPHDLPVPTLQLARGERERVWVVNQMTGPAAIHWHGIELESYFDGVPGWSGDPGHLAPLIAPGDSFAAEMTPPRAGTFIYHAHLENGHQLSSGLYGALLVSDAQALGDSARDIVLLYGGGELVAGDAPYLNGSRSPGPRRLTRGVTYRVRIINIIENNSIGVTITFRAHPVEWRPLAKDGADLPPRDRTVRPASVQPNVGETYDFEFTPATLGDYYLETVRPNGVVQRQLWKVTAP